MTNEFHLPYRAIVRVYFGTNCVKTIEGTAVPKANGETTLLWKLYRNFAMTHPLDEGPINKARRVTRLSQHAETSLTACRLSEAASKYLASS